jgi:two-component system NarL family sensor kinase
MADKMEPPVNVDYVYNNLAAVLTQIGRETQSAWYYLEKAEKSAIGHKDFVLLTKVMNNKGFACNARKMWDSSLYYFNRSLQLSRKQQLQEAEYLALMNIAIVLLEQKKPEKALPYLQQAQQIQGHVHPAYKNMLYGALGLTYLLLGDYKKAEPLLLAEYNGAVARNNRSNMKEAHYNLYRLYGATKDYQKAYEHANGYITINNTIGGDEIIRNVNQEEVRFRTAEKDQDLLEKRLIIEKQEKSLERKNRWISIIVSSAIIFLLLVFVVVKSYHNRQKMMKQKMSNLQQQKEIERLKANIEGEESERTRIARELHDGIGGLISAAQLNMRTLGKESPGIKASETFRSTTSILEEAAGELRKTAHNMMPSVLLRQNMEGAITAFCNYIRQGRQLAIDVQCYGNFETLPDSYRIAIYRIVQELSNNVAKHSEATAALVQLMFQQPVMSITIEDNGKGFDPDNILNKKNGMGLKNVMERVKSMNGTISLDTMPGKGTSVYIELEIPGAVP